MQLPRHLTALLLGAVLPISLAACAPDTDEADLDAGTPAAEPAPAPAPAPATDDAMTAQLTPLGNSGIAGEIEVDDEDAQTRVKVRLTGSTANTVHQGHIHMGTCESPGEVVVALEPITIGDDGTGEAESTVAVAPMTAMDGQHIVAYHGADGAPVTCAAIPQHAM